MATYKKSIDLEGKTLQYGDEILLLASFSFIVFFNHIYSSSSGMNNDALFTLLRLDKTKFCEEHYGYSSKTGIWPQSKHRDYEALTRATLALMKLFEKMPKDLPKEITLEKFMSQVEDRKFKIYSHGDMEEFKNKKQVSDKLQFHGENSKDLLGSGTELNYLLALLKNL